MKEASIVGLPLDVAALVQRSAGLNPLDVLCHAVAARLEREEQARRAERNRLALRASLVALRAQSQPARRS